MRIIPGAPALILPLLLVACANGGPVAQRPGAHADLYPIESVAAPMAVDVPLGADAGRGPGARRRLEAFAQAYADRGRGGPVEVTAARRADAEEAAAALAMAGLPRAAVRVRTDPAARGARAVFAGSAVRVPGCAPAAAAEDLAAAFGERVANTPHPLMGCATMRNIGVMLADPRDLDEPRTLRPGDGARAATVVERWRAPKEPAEPTASVKGK